jgi:hypothetical protein
MEFEGLIIPVALIGLWILAYQKTVKVFGPEARRNFFIWMIVAVGGSVISFFVVVDPNLECTGSFCNLAYIVMWIGIVFLLLVLPPVLLLLRAFKNER